MNSVVMISRAVSEERVRASASRLFGVSSEAIGRAPAIGRLREVIRRLAVKESGAEVVVLTGEAGVGKTRLLGETVRIAQEAGFWLAFGQAHAYDRSLPYSSVSEVLASFNEQDLMVTAAASLTAARQAVDMPTHDDHDPRSIVAAVVELLRDLLDRSPVVVLLDDAHLADDASLTTWAMVARHLRAESFGLVVTIRGDKWLPGTSFAATVGRLVEASRDGVIRLEPLDPGDVANLIQDRLGAVPDSRLVRHVFERSRGNPLFARETIEGLGGGGGLRTERGFVFLRGVPESGIGGWRAALLQRLFQQDERSLRVARVLSAFSRISRSQLELLAELAGLSSDEVSQALDDLVSAGFVIGDHAGWFSFSHPLVSEVLYDDLGPTERRRIHAVLRERLAVATSETGDEADLYQWARHAFESADAVDPAAAAAALRAANAVRRRAPAVAGLWYDRARRLLPQGDSRLGEVLARQSTSYWKGSRPELAVTAGRRAIALLPPGGLRDATVRSTVSALYAMGRLRNALELLDEAGTESPGFVAQRAVVQAALGDSDRVRESEAAAWLRIDECELAERVIAYCYLGHGASIRADGEAMTRATTQLSEFGSSTLVPPAQRLSALETNAYLLVHESRLLDAQALIAEAEQVAQLSGWEDIGGQAAYARARAAYLQGDWDEALRLIAAGAVDLEVAGLPYNLAWLRLLEVDILLERGQHMSAEDILDSIDAQGDWACFAAWAGIRRARIAAGRAQLDQAEDILDDVVASSRQRQWDGIASQALYQLVLIRTDRGDLEGARPLALDLADLARARARRDKTWAAAPAEVLSGTRGDLSGVRDVQRVAAHEGLVFDRAIAELALAKAGDGAQQRLQIAFDLFATLGAGPWVTRVQVEARRQNLTVTRARVQRDTALTENEKQLVSLVREGLNNREIAEVMHYSRKTVEAYLTRLYRKVGAKSRIGLLRAVDESPDDAS